MQGPPTSTTQAEIRESQITAHIRHIKERRDWQQVPFQQELRDMKLCTVVQLADMIDHNDTVDWIIILDGYNTDKEDENNKEFKHIRTRLIKIRAQHNCTEILQFTCPRMVNSETMDTASHRTTNPKFGG